MINDFPHHVSIIHENAARRSTCRNKGTETQPAPSLLHQPSTIAPDREDEPENVTILAQGKADLAAIQHRRGRRGIKSANICDEEFSFSAEGMVRLSTLLALFPAVAVTGPWQSGKSTLLRTAAWTWRLTISASRMVLRPISCCANRRTAACRRVVIYQGVTKRDWPSPGSDFLNLRGRHCRVAGGDETSARKQSAKGGKEELIGTRGGMN